MCPAPSNANVNVRGGWARDYNRPCSQALPHEKRGCYQQKDVNHNNIITVDSEKHTVYNLLISGPTFKPSQVLQAIWGTIWLNIRVPKIKARGILSPLRWALYVGQTNIPPSSSCTVINNYTIHELHNIVYGTHQNVNNKAYWAEEIYSNVQTPQFLRKI